MAYTAFKFAFTATCSLTFAAPPVPPRGPARKEVVGVVDNHLCRKMAVSGVASLDQCSECKRPVWPTVATFTGGEKRRGMLVGQISVEIGTYADCPTDFECTSTNPKDNLAKCYSVNTLESCEMDQNQGSWAFKHLRWHGCCDLKTKKFYHLDSVSEEQAEEEGGEYEDPPATSTNLPVDIAPAGTIPVPTPLPQNCRACLTTCAPCQDCTDGPSGSFAMGSCKKCWHCWDWDDDELEDEDNEMDEECDALHRDHDWDDEEVRCLHDAFTASELVLARSGGTRPTTRSSSFLDCRACWADLSTKPAFV